MTVTLALATAALAPACSETYDAYFANPCRHDLRIEVHRRGPVEVDESSALRTVVVPAGGVKLVESAFGDHSNAVSLPEGRLPIEVDEAELPHDTVVLPATYCEES